MNNVLIYCINFLGSAHFLFLTMLSSFSLKGFICASLAVRQSDGRLLAKRTIRLLFGILILLMLIDTAWIIKLVKDLWIPSIDFRVHLFVLRISWAFHTFQQFSKLLFIDALSKTQNKTRLVQSIFFGMSIIFACCFLYISILYLDGTRIPLEFKLFTIIPWVNLLLAGFCLLAILSKLQEKKVPKIIKTQLKTIITYFFIPSLFFDLIQLFPFSMTPNFFGQNYLSVSVASLVPTYALYYCAKQLMKLRFLNIHTHVQSDQRFNFIDDFKDVLQNLSLVSSPKELGYVSQRFLKDALDIPITKTTFHIRNLDSSHPEQLPLAQTLVENFITINQNNRAMIDFVKKNRLIFIRDEIEFNHFSSPNPTSGQVVQFLEGINADIFIPIFEKKTLNAYIIIERDARTNSLYSDVERDEMLIFARYIGTIVKLLRTRNLNELLIQQKSLREELLAKHQEINQYKESMRSFLRSNKMHTVGIIFYKKRKFTLANPTAKSLVTVNLNTQAGHPLTQKIKKMAQHVEEFKSPQTSFILNAEGERIVLTAFYNAEHNNVIITVAYPEVSDVLKKQIEALKDPSRWDYLLYLETTKSGKLVNQLIPGSGEHILNFKIDLLKMALTPKAIMLEMPEEDLRSTVEIIHHISLRETLHIVAMQSPEKDDLTTGIKLFGLNPIFGGNTEQPLLEKLDSTGTLFIQNIHHLSLETQEYLTEYIKCGWFKLIKSDQKKTSNVRLIFSTNQDLAILVEEGKFSKSLYAVLKHITLVLPPLYSLPQEELSQLADELTEQALRTSTFKNMLELTDKEKMKLTHKKPVSLHEFKEKVQYILVNKSKKNDIYEDTEFDAAYNISDPQLVEAVRLGKHALRDPKIMTMLWNKFQNQNKMATFLGVNRSSVSRRCKEYNLE